MNFCKLNRLKHDWKDHILTALPFLTSFSFFFAVVGASKLQRVVLTNNLREFPR
jgi:hypothetical protein